MFYFKFSLIIMAVLLYQQPSLSQKLVRPYSELNIEIGDENDGSIDIITLHIFLHLNECKKERITLTCLNLWTDTNPSFVNYSNKSATEGTFIYSWLSPPNPSDGIWIGKYVDSSVIDKKLNLGSFSLIKTHNTLEQLIKPIECSINLSIIYSDYPKVFEVLTNLVVVPIKKIEITSKSDDIEIQSTSDNLTQTHANILI